MHTLLLYRNFFTKLSNILDWLKEKESIALCENNEMILSWVGQIKLAELDEMVYNRKEEISAWIIRNEFKQQPAKNALSLLDCKVFIDLYEKVLVWLSENDYDQLHKLVGEEFTQLQKDGDIDILVYNAIHAMNSTLKEKNLKLILNHSPEDIKQYLELTHQDIMGLQSNLMPCESGKRMEKVRIKAIACHYEVWADVYKFMSNETTMQN